MGQGGLQPPVVTIRGVRPRGLCRYRLLDNQDASYSLSKCGLAVESTSLYKEHYGLSLLTLSEFKLPQNLPPYEVFPDPDFYH